MTAGTAIVKLRAIREKYQFSFIIKHRPLDWMNWVQVSSGELSWEVLVYDEFHDLKESNDLVCLYLVLNSLEDYKETDDYLAWCKENMITRPDFSEYYKLLGSVYSDFERILGKVKSFISPMDYELRAGEYAALLEWKPANR